MVHADREAPGGECSLTQHGHSHYSEFDLSTLKCYGVDLTSLVHSTMSIEYLSGQCCISVCAFHMGMDELIQYKKYQISLIKRKS